MEPLVKLIVASLLLGGLVSADIEDSCLDCIARVEQGEARSCKMDGGTVSCGVYQIKESYWIDCGRPGGSYRACAYDESCSRTCIKNYMRRYEGICKQQLNKGTLSCLDYGKLHNGGPFACAATTDALTHYIGLINQRCYREVKNLPYSTGPTSNCLSCIARVERGRVGVCKDGLCGAHMISEGYWADSGRPGRSFQECINDVDCTARSVKAFMMKYEENCLRESRKSTLTCIDYAKLHNGGPNGCSAARSNIYVRKVMSICPAELLRS